MKRKYEHTLKVYCQERRIRQYACVPSATYTINYDIWDLITRWPKMSYVYIFRLQATNNSHIVLW